MTCLITLPHNGKTVDVSAIVAIGAIFENYKYVEPFLFSVNLATDKGGADLLIGNESYSQAQDDYGVLMQAWQQHKTAIPAEASNKEMLTVDDVVALAKAHNLRCFFYWPHHTEDNARPTPTGLQIAFHNVIEPAVWETLMTTPCEVPVETRGFRDPISWHVRPEYRQAFRSVNAKRKSIGWDPVALHPGDPLNR